MDGRRWWHVVVMHHGFFVSWLVLLLFILVVVYLWVIFNRIADVRLHYYNKRLIFLSRALLAV